MLLQDKKLALFFSCGVSLSTWERMGNLSREIQLYNLLAKEFSKIYFFTYGSKDEMKFKSVLPKNIQILPKKISLPSKIYQFFIPLIYRKELKGTDFYKTNQMNASIPAVLSKWLYRKRLVLRCGYEWLKVKEKEKKSFWKCVAFYFLEAVAYKYADKILITSPADKKYIQLRFNRPSSQIEVIPNFIDAAIFRPMAKRKKKNTICFVGRLSPEKNLINLIKAISDLNVTLLIFGSGPLQHDLQVLAKRLNANVEFKGNVPNEHLPMELNKTQLFILPSLYEGNPKALLEAMACALPCITTYLDEIKEIIEHKKNGYLCATETRSIRRAILNLLENNSLRDKIARNAARTIIEKYSLPSILQKELTVYRSI